MGSSWEIDSQDLISSSKCACGQGTIKSYKVELSHTKVIRSKTEYETEISCPNSECPSK
ncbi:hypothetical protein D3C87_482860 [compost metagenome]